MAELTFLMNADPAGRPEPVLRARQEYFAAPEQP